MLQTLAIPFARASHSLRPLADPAFGRFLVKPAQFHFPEYALSLHAFLENSQRLIDVIVVYVYFQNVLSVNLWGDFLSSGGSDTRTNWGWEGRSVRLPCKSLNIS